MNERAMGKMRQARATCNKGAAKLLTTVSQRCGGHMSHAAKTISMEPGRQSAFALQPERSTIDGPGQTANANRRHPLTSGADRTPDPQPLRAPRSEAGTTVVQRQPMTRGAQPATLPYTPQFAALLGGGSAPADIARIKSPAFAASLSSGRESGRHRSVAVGAVLACILVAGSAAALWQFSGNRTARAPGFAGTLMIADSTGVAPPGTRTAVFEVEAGASDPPQRTMAGDPVGYPAEPVPADAAPSRRALQAAIDAAPFRSSILGIATAGLQIGSGDSASGGGSAIADPSFAPALDPNAAADLSTPVSSSLAGSGLSPLSSAMQGEGLPSRGDNAGNPPGNEGHRGAERSNYVAAFTREAFRTTAAVATVARSLRSDSAEASDTGSEPANADGESSDPGASIDQGNSNGSGQVADGSEDPGASANHKGFSGLAGDGRIADGRSKADNGSRSADGPGNAGGSPQGSDNQASQGESAAGSASSSGGSADSSPGTGRGAVASAASGQIGKGHAKEDKGDSGDAGQSGQPQGGQQAGDQDGGDQHAKSQGAHGKDNGGDAAGQDGDSARGGGGDNGGEGENGSDAGPAGKGHGDQGGGDQGGGKGHGGKGDGGKGHGGKDHGGKGGG
ncbi:MAG TPA: hypothetical protein VFG64_04415 [Dongiaceae bacterium]|nr:hypothetical protein [Dongiaceae bacterium]